MSDSEEFCPDCGGDPWECGCANENSDEEKF